MSTGGGSFDRGQSEVLGIVLLFALVLTVTSAVVLVGGQAINDAKSDTSSASAEQTMQELQSASSQSDASTSDNEISFAQTGGGSDEASGSGVDAADGSARIRESDSVTVDDTAGELRIEITDADGSDPSPIVEDLGRITYEEDGEIIAYEGGGVFRKSKGSDESTIVSSPDFEFTHQNGPPTLSMRISLLSTSGSDVSGDSFTVRQTDSTRYFPAASMPELEDGDSITITIQSEYYKAWAELFRTETDGATVTEYDATSEAELVLDGMPSDETIEQALQIGNGGTISNSGKVDSYQSGGSGYPSTYTMPHRENAEVTINGDFQAQNDPIIGGDLHVTGDFDTTETPEIYGDTYVGGTTSFQNDPVLHGTLYSQGTVSSGSATFNDIVVGTDFASSGNAIRHAEVNGDIYAHGTIGQNSGGAPFRPDRVDGSIRATDSITFDHYSPVEVGGDIVSDQDVVVGDNLVLTGSNQEIHAGGDVEVNGGTHDVDIVAAGNVHLDSGTNIQGSVHASSITGSGSADSTTTGPSADDPEPADVPPVQSSTVEPLPSTETAIEQRRSLTNPSENNNDDVSVISQIESGGCGSCTLPDGKYVFTNGIDIGSSDSLTLDTSGGDITMYVDGSVDINGEVEVVGPGTVRIYKDNGHDVHFGSDAEISTPGDRAGQFWMYLWPDGTAVRLQEDDGAHFTGVIYGTGSSDSAVFHVSNDQKIYGALVGDLGSMSGDTEYHYDESLGSESIFGDGGSSGDRVQYIRLTGTEVTVQD